MRMRKEMGVRQEDGDGGEKENKEMNKKENEKKNEKEKKM